MIAWRLDPFWSDNETQQHKRPVCRALNSFERVPIIGSMYRQRK